MSIQKKFAPKRGDASGQGGYGGAGSYPWGVNPAFPLGLTLESRLRGGIGLVREICVNHVICGDLFFNISA